SSIDPYGRRLFYLGSDGINTFLVTTQLPTGVTSQVNTPGLFGFAEYDSTTGMIIAARGSNVVAVSPATGSTTTIRALPVSGVAQGESSFDPLTRRLFYLGTTNGTDTLLVTLPLAGGAATQVSVPGANGFAEFDPDTGRIVTIVGSNVVSV